MGCAQRARARRHVMRRLRHKHPGACAAIVADDPLSTLDDYMQAFWFDPPCLMFDGGLR